MIKIGTTTDGNVIVEMSIDEWEHIESNGLDVILDSAEIDKRRKNKEEEWRNSPVFEILKPLFSKRVYSPIHYLFLRGKFDGSIEQLHIIARGEYPFEDIRGIGKLSRKILLDVLSKQDDKGNDK